VDSTARDAMFCDHYVVVAEDCVASDDPEQHAASMLLMRHRFDLASAEKIENSWAAAAPRAAAGR
jgi:nicotinamidase-related amidase